MQAIAIGAGAALGAWLRWALTIWLGGLPANIPGGTITANLIGAYAAGLAIGFFSAHPSLDPIWRLFLITGVLGGLTTFSSFAVEATLLLERQAYGLALVHSGLHWLGSIALCIAGLASYRALA